MMKSMNRFWPWAGGFVSLVLVLTLGGCTVVRHDAKTAKETAVENGEFDATAYVEKYWADKIVPELVNNAVDLTTVVAGLGSNTEGTRTKYGRRQEETAPFTFIVKGSVQVKAANLESAAATLTLKAAAPTPEGEVLLQIGPVIQSSAIRDVLPFVHFGDFTNQVDFANLSRAINAHVKNAVVNGLDREHLVGKTITFIGAFVEDAAGRVLITPVVVKVDK